MSTTPNATVAAALARVRATHTATPKYRNEPAGTKPPSDAVECSQCDDRWPCSHVVLADAVEAMEFDYHSTADLIGWVDGMADAYQPNGIPRGANELTYRAVAIKLRRLAELEARESAGGSTPDYGHAITVGGPMWEGIPKY